jgi:hypothetical protein
VGVFSGPAVQSVAGTGCTLRVLFHPAGPGRSTVHSLVSVSRFGLFGGGGFSLVAFVHYALRPSGTGRTPIFLDDEAS